MNTVNQIFLIRILSNKTQRLLKMKELEKDYKSVDELIDKSKPIIFWQEKPIIKKQLSVWNLSDLKKIIYEINNIEILCKKKSHTGHAIIIYDDSTARALFLLQSFFTGGGGAQSDTDDDSAAWARFFLQNRLIL